MATHPTNRKTSAEQAQCAKDERGRIGPGISPKARAVFEAALAKRPKRSLYEALASMPNVGLDSDFEFRHNR